MPLSTTPSSNLVPPAPPPRKETAAQHVERVKRERPSWSILDDIRRYAREGFDSIPADDLAVRLRAWGLYTQGDGAGVRGEAIRHFMMRVRTPNGVLTSAMCRTLADLAERYARGTLDITNRQNFQLHWLRIEDVPAVWDALAAVGWTSQGACGDNTRTVTGCPLAGVDAGEIIDASPVAVAVDRHMNGHPDFANLPRKFKISITGCQHWCTYPEINDIGLTAIRRGDETGFSLRVGGGLSTRPHMAVRLDAFVHWDQVVAVTEAVAGIFRDSDVLRVSRAKARMKYLFLTQGWTADRFLSELNSRLGFTLDPAVAEEHAPIEHFRDHVGIHPQRQPGLSYAGFSVAAGRLRPSLLRRIADWAEEYGDGTLRTTIAQNLVVLNVPDARVASFEQAVGSGGIAPVASPFQRGIVACTGSEFCKLALVETKAFSLNLIPDLERRLPNFSQHLRIHVTGCPNACGQHSIADIGLQGVQVEDAGQQVDGFELFVGGGLGRDADFAHRVGVRLPATRVASALETLLRAYLATREEGDVFRTWTARVTDARLKELLAA
jgi:sulfite reductase (ferredoxin)